MRLDGKNLAIFVTPHEKYNKPNKILLLYRKRENETRYFYLEKRDNLEVRNFVLIGLLGFQILIDTK